MSTCYELKGTLTFATEEDAARAYAALSDPEESLFWVEPGTARPGADLVLDGKRLVLDDSYFSSGESFYTTQSLVRRVAAMAVAGQIRCQDGDGGPGTSVSTYGPAAQEHGD